MKVSVIVPVYNSENLIGPCLESLLGQDYPDYEIIVSDDGSTDRTLEVARRYPVTVLAGPRRGISASRNRAIEAARGEIILSVDSDLTVGNDLIRAMVAPFSDPAVGATMAWWEISNPEFLTAALIHKTYEYLTRDLGEMDFFWSYCIAFPRKLAREVGGFHTEPYYNYVEDVDFAYRILGRGRRILFLREVVVKHYFRDSLWKHLKRHWLIARNKLIYVLTQRNFFDQRSQPIEYLKLLLHTALIASLPVAFFTPLPFLVLGGLCLISHLPITLWGMKSGSRYLLLLPFEFVTKLSWVVGMACGMVVYLKMRLAGKLPAPSPGRDRPA